MHGLSGFPFNSVLDNLVVFLLVQLTAYLTGGRPNLIRVKSVSQRTRHTRILTLFQHNLLLRFLRLSLLLKRPIFIPGIQNIGKVLLVVVVHVVVALGTLIVDALDGGALPALPD